MRKRWSFLLGIILTVALSTGSIMAEEIVSEDVVPVEAETHDDSKENPIELPVGTTIISAADVYSFTPPTTGVYHFSSPLVSESVNIEGWGDGGWRETGLLGSMDMGVLGDDGDQFYAKLEGGKRYSITTAVLDGPIWDFPLTITKEDVTVSEIGLGDNTINPNQLYHFTVPEDGYYIFTPAEYSKMELYFLNENYGVKRFHAKRCTLHAGDELIIAFELAQGINTVNIARADDNCIPLTTVEGTYIKNGTLYTFTPEISGRYRVSTDLGQKPYLSATSNRESAFEGRFNEFVVDDYYDDGVNINVVWNLVAGTTYFFKVGDELRDNILLYTDYEGPYVETPEQEDQEEIVPDIAEVVDSGVTQTPETPQVADTIEEKKTAPKTTDPGMPMALPLIAAVAGAGMILCRGKK